MKKRIIAIVLAVTMAVSLSACGNKSDTKTGNKVILTMDEIQEKMAEAIPHVKSVDADLDMALDLSMKARGEEVSLKAGLDGEVQVSISNPGYHIKCSGSMSSAGLGDNDLKESGEMEVYMVTDADTATGYYTTDGKEWFTSSMSMDEFMAELTAMLAEMNITEWRDIDFSDSGELSDDNNQLATIARLLEKFPPILKSETVQAAGKECYEISTTINKTTLADLPGMEEYVAVLENMLGECECKAAVYVDVATNLPIKVEITADFSADIQSVPSADGSFEERSIKLNECKAVLELKYDTVEAIEVPSKVKDSAVEQDEISEQ